MEGKVYTYTNTESKQSIGLVEISITESSLYSAEAKLKMMLENDYDRFNLTRIVNIQPKQNGK